MNNDSSLRIVDALREWIESSVPGARLPTSRMLVNEHRASPVTVQKALRILVAQGLIETRPGAGTFVRAVRTARPLDYSWQTAAMRPSHSRISAPSPALRAAPQGMIALHAGYPDRELLPVRLIRSALVRAARSEAALARSPVAGLPELQSWFANELGAATPAGVTPPTPSDVVVLPGSQSGLATIFRALVTSRRPLLMESPTYWGAIQAAAQVGVEIVPVPSGPTGPDPDALARAFQETGSRVFYSQPNYANPTGAQWADAAATQILDVVRAHDAFLVEDDWAHDFGINTDPRPVAARDDTGHVVYVRSLTKSISPSIRIAAIIARGPARDRILADRGAESMYVSGFLQAAALDVVTQPGWQTHLRNLRPQLRARRDLLLMSLREHAPDAHIATVPAGGLNLWARLPDATNLDRLVADCEAAGVVVGAGSSWFPAEPTGPFIRLNYSGPNPGAFADGARAIGRALASNR